MTTKKLGFYEFFAGGGMVRQALGRDWQCLFANDISHEKARSYAENWGSSELRVQDIADVSTSDLKGHADLAWASFPCQDLSLAGSGAGLKGSRSGTFWIFNELLKKLAGDQRLPKTVVLENVNGFLTSHQGKDFVQVLNALTAHGYRCGALVMDAEKFVPQSRPRVFVVAALPELNIATHSIDHPVDHWTTSTLTRAYQNLPGNLQENWVWWNVPRPKVRNINLGDLVEHSPNSVAWDSEEETLRILNMMAPLHLQKVERARESGSRLVGTLYKRTRKTSDGHRVQRAEVRFDGIAGCLRTPGGGSSRQRIIVVEGAMIRTRLLSARETARLMGLPDSYILPEKYNAAYHLTGDGVVVPVVRHLSTELLNSLLTSKSKKSIAA